MAHKTLVNGTAYEISGSKTLVNGTAYSVKNGKTLVEGTAYEVAFEKMVDILLDRSNGSYGGKITVTIEGTTYNGGLFNTANIELSIPAGAVIECKITVAYNEAAEITLNGTQVAYLDAGAANRVIEYSYIASRNTTFVWNKPNQLSVAQLNITEH